MIQLVSEVCEYANNLFLDEKITGVQCKEDDVCEHLSVLKDGGTIKILNCTDDQYAGYFVGMTDSYILIECHRAIAKVYTISSKDMIEILGLFYAYRTISSLNADYSDVTFKISERLLRLILK